MKLKVDRRADALYLTLSESPSSRSEEVSPGIIVDYDDRNRVVGIEMLYFDCCSSLSRELLEEWLLPCPAPPSTA